MLPEVGVHRKSASQGGQRHQEESNCFHWMVLLYCDSERIAAVDEHVKRNAALLDRALRGGLQMAAGGAIRLHHVHDGGGQTGQRFVLIEYGGPRLYQGDVELI